MAETWCELANIEASVMVFGALVVQGSVRWEIVMIGLLLFSILEILRVSPHESKALMSRLIVFLMDIGIVAIAIGIFALSKAHERRPDLVPSLFFRGGRHGFWLLVLATTSRGTRRISSGGDGLR